MVQFFFQLVMQLILLLRDDNIGNRCLICEEENVILMHMRGFQVYISQQYKIALQVAPCVTRV